MTASPPIIGSKVSDSILSRNISNEHIFDWPFDSVDFVTLLGLIESGELMSQDSDQVETNTIKDDGMHAIVQEDLTGVQVSSD